MVRCQLGSHRRGMRVCITIECNFGDELKIGEQNNSGSDSRGVSNLFQWKFRDFTILEKEIKGTK